jgi:hypothetical protein
MLLEIFVVRFHKNPNFAKETEERIFSTNPNGRVVTHGSCCGCERFSLLPHRPMLSLCSPCCHVSCCWLTSPDFLSPRRTATGQARRTPLPFIERFTGRRNIRAGWLDSSLILGDMEQRQVKSTESFLVFFSFLFVFWRKEKTNNSEVRCHFQWRCYPLPSLNNSSLWELLARTGRYEYLGLAC